jgi:ADP-heptose:LPS heptosyltransferase
LHIERDEPERQKQKIENQKMKITIRHDQNSIDPSATYTDEQFAEVKESLESQYTQSILAEYPEAEIEFEDSTDTYCLAVKDTGLDDPSEIHFNIQRITETVFETGLFWL